MAKNVLIVIGLFVVGVLVFCLCCYKVSNLLYQLFSMDQNDEDRESQADQQDKAPILKKSNNPGNVPTPPPIRQTPPMSHSYHRLAVNSEGSYLENPTSPGQLLVSSHSLGAETLLAENNLASSPQSYYQGGSNLRLHSEAIVHHHIPSQSNQGYSGTHISHPYHQSSGQYLNSLYSSPTQERQRCSRHQKLNQVEKSFEMESRTSFAMENELFSDVNKPRNSIPLSDLTTMMQSQVNSQFTNPCGIQSDCRQDPADLPPYVPPPNIQHNCNGVIPRHSGKSETPYKYKPHRLASSYTNLHDQSKWQPSKAQYLAGLKRSRTGFEEHTCKERYGERAGYEGGSHHATPLLHHRVHNNHQPHPVGTSLARASSVSYLRKLSNDSLFQRSEKHEVSHVDEAQLVASYSRHGINLIQQHDLTALLHRQHTPQQVHRRHPQQQLMRGNSAGSLGHPGNGIDDDRLDALGRPNELADGGEIGYRGHHVRPWQHELPHSGSHVKQHNNSQWQPQYQGRSFADHRPIGAGKTASHYGPGHPEATHQQHQEAQQLQQSQMPHHSLKRMASSSSMEPGQGANSVMSPRL